jgi:hypothetical protein
VSTDDRIELRNGTIIANGTKTLTHKADGTRSFQVYIEGGIYYYEINCTGSETVNLDTIPRASTITSAGNVTLGNKCDVRWTPLAASFRYKLEFSLGNWKYTTGAIHPNKTSAYTYSGYTIPMEVANQIRNGYTGKMTVKLYSFSDSSAKNQIGSADTETFTVTVPKSASPTVTMSLSPVHSLPAAFDGIYVQGLSKVKAVLTGETQYGADILYYDMTIAGNTYDASDDYTSAFLTTPGTVDVIGHVKDSRTYDGYAPEQINVIPYAKPKIQNVTASRCDGNGNLTDSGTYLKITATRSYHPVISNGVQKNFCGIRYRYKSENALNYSDWVTILDARTLGTDDVVTDPLLEGSLLVTNSYRVEVQAFDDIGNTAPSEVLVSTDKVYWHRDGVNNALGLGKYNERKNALDLAWDLYMNGHKIFGLGDPENDEDVVSRGYVANNVFQNGSWISNKSVNEFYPTGCYRIAITNDKEAEYGWPPAFSGGGSLLSLNVVGGIVSIQFAFSWSGSMAVRSYWYDSGWLEWKHIV